MQNIKPYQMICLQGPQLFAIVFVVCQIVSGLNVTATVGTFCRQNLQKRLIKLRPFLFPLDIFSPHFQIRPKCPKYAGNKGVIVTIKR